MTEYLTADQKKNLRGSAEALHDPIGRPVFNTPWLAIITRLLDEHDTLVEGVKEQTMNDKLAIVFDGPPGDPGPSGPASGRFVEVELNGASIRLGKWEQNDGLWELVLPAEYAALAATQPKQEAADG